MGGDEGRKEGGKSTIYVHRLSFYRVRRYSYELQSPCCVVVVEYFGDLCTGKLGIKKKERKRDQEKNDVRRYVFVIPLGYWKLYVF